MCMTVLYTLNYYEDKYFISLFTHFKHKGKTNNKSLKCIFWGRIFKVYLFLKMYFLRERFWRALTFWNVIFEGAIYLEFMVAD